MPINPSIPLQGQVANPLNALASGYQLGNTIRQQPMVDQMNQQKLQAGEIELKDAKMKQMEAIQGMAKGSLQADYYGAVQIAPYLASGDMASVERTINQRKQAKQLIGMPTDTEDNFLKELQNNPEQAKKSVANMMAIGQQLFGKSQASRSVALNPGGQLYSQDGTLLAQNSNVRPGAQQSDYFTTESTPQGLVQVNTRVPNDVRPLTGPDGKPLFRSQYDVDLQSRINEGKSQGTATGKTAAARESQFEDWTAFQQSFAEAYPDIGTLMQAAPESSMSQFINNYGVKLIGSTSPYEAQAQIEQLGAILLQQVPFPPGAQSEAEMLQRNKTLGKLEDPNISPNTKLDMIGRFLRMNEAKFRALRNNKADYDALPSGALPRTNPRGWTLHQDANGNKAYVGPNGEIEEVQ